MHLVYGRWRRCTSFAVQQGQDLAIQQQRIDDQTHCTVGNNRLRYRNVGKNALASKA
jgi:hypothetical protein